MSSANTENGGPLIMLIMLLTCHPPTMCEIAPSPSSQRCPGPNGSCHKLVMPTLWVRSVLMSE